MASCWIRCRAGNAWDKWRVAISISYRDKLRKLIAGLRGKEDAILKSCFFNVVRNGANSIKVADQQLGKPSQRRQIDMLSMFLWINNEEQKDKRYFGIAPMTPPIVHLDLARNELGVSGGRIICQSLSQNTVVRSVELSDNKLTGDLQLPNFKAIEALSRALRLNPCLTLLGLARNNIGGWADKRGVDTLADGLKASHSLTAVNLCGNRLNDNDLGRLTVGLRGMRRQLNRDVELRANLNLSGNPLPGALGCEWDGIEKLCACIRFDRLKCLNLSNCRLCGVHTLGRGGGISKSSSSAAGPMLGKYSAYGIQMLAAAVSATSTLTSLNLSANYFCYKDSSMALRQRPGDKTAGSSSHSATPSCMDEREEIDPSRSSVSTAHPSGAIVALGRILRENTSLLQLNLSANCIGALELPELSQALPINDTLTSLDLQNNEFGTQGALALANGLSENFSLRSINLNGTRIGKRGCSQINAAFIRHSNAVQTHKCRRTLDVSRMELRLCIMQKQVHRGMRSAASLDDFDYI